MPMTIFRAAGPVVALPPPAVSSFLHPTMITSSSRTQTGPTRSGSKSFCDDVLLTILMLPPRVGSCAFGGAGHSLVSQLLSDAVNRDGDDDRRADDDHAVFLGQLKRHRAQANFV